MNKHNLVGLIWVWLCWLLVLIFTLSLLESAHAARVVLILAFPLYYLSKWLIVPEWQR